jgi:chromosome partitioning protein
MNNRGLDRGMFQRTVPRAGRAQAAPRPCGDASPYRPPSPADIRATVPLTPMDAPVQPQPDGAAPDRAEEQAIQVPAKLGWRDRLSRLNRIEPGTGKQQAYESGLRERVRVSVGRAFAIAVVSAKSGVGKTAVIEALGSTFADARDDRVIAVDVDTGDLVNRNGHRNGSGLEVFGHSDYAHSDWQIKRDDVVKAFSMLRKRYSVLLVDCGKSLKSNVTEAALLESQAVVLVTSTAIDAIRKSSTTLDWLGRNGYQNLTDSAVLVINHTEQRKPKAWVAKELRQLSARFSPERVVVLPFDRHVHDGKAITLSQLSKDSRRRYLELAAALADMAPRPDRANPAAKPRT